MGDAAILGGFGSALCWTVAGLCTARLSRALRPLPALAWTQIVGLALVLPFAIALAGRPHLTAPALGWAAAYAVAVIAALALTYRAFEVGKVGVVSPVISADGGLAALAAVILGETLAPVAGVGLAVIVLGVVLSGMRDDASGPGGGSSRRAIFLALGAAVGFTVTYVVASRARSDGLQTAWVIWGARVLGVAFVTVPVFLHSRPALPREHRLAVLVSAAADSLGFALFLWAAAESLAIAAVLSTQYATLTAIAGVVLFRERLTRLQWTGTALVLAGVTLVAAQ